MDNREMLDAFGGDTERYDKREQAKAELEAIAIQKKAFIDQVVGTFYDKEGRFAINETARLYNAADIKSFMINVAEPGPNSTTTPGFIPALSVKELRELLEQNQNADVAIPVFADSNCLQDCIGFVICRGGDSFEILDANPFGANHYSKDELYGLMKGAREKCSWLNMAQKEDNLDQERLLELIGKNTNFFLKDEQYTEDAARMKARLLESTT